MWVVVNGTQLVFTVVWTVGCISFAGVIFLLSRSRRIALDLARSLWAPGLLAMAGARLRVRGAGGVMPSLPDRPCVFVANHQSVIDICALFRGLPRPVRFVAKRELRRVPFLGWYIAVMGMAFVDRRAKRGQGAVDAMAGLLRGGSDVIVFPEGTRSRDGAIAPFKRSGFQAAIDVGAPIVPIAIRGAGSVLPPGGFRVRPGIIELIIGAPILATDSFDRQQLAALAESAVRDLYAEPAEPGEHREPVALSSSDG